MGISTSTFADVNSKETFDPILFPPENSLHAQVQHIEIDVAKNKVSMSLSAMQGALFSKIIESTASASPFSPTTPNSLNGSTTTTTLIPTVFSVLEYPLSDFESALVCVASYLDTTDLCNFSRYFVCYIIQCVTHSLSIAIREEFVNYLESWRWIIKCIYGRICIGPTN